jgi:hypothetical protein
LDPAANLLDLGPVVERELKAYMRRLLLYIGALYLNEDIDSAPPDFPGNQFPAQFLEFNEVFRNTNGNVELFGVKSAHFNADGIASLFHAAAAKSSHTENQGRLLYGFPV